MFPPHIVIFFTMFNSLSILYWIILFGKTLCEKNNNIFCADVTKIIEMNIKGDFLKDLSPERVKVVISERYSERLSPEQTKVVISMIKLGHLSPKQTKTVISGLYTEHLSPSIIYLFTCSVIFVPNFTN